MDLSRPVYYRGLNLNDATAAAGRMPISGRQLDQVSIGAVTGVGYTEKRSQADGRDSSDVYLDGRRFLLSGSVFGESRSEAFDKLQEIRSVFTPTGAFADRPGAYGYLPLAWQEPTLDSRYPLDDVTQLRFRDLYANCRPLATPEVRMDRDRSGGKEGLGAGFQYSVQLEARDPRIYVDPAVMQDLTDNTTSQSGTWENRGDYPSPLKALFVINPHAATTGRITVEAGGSQMLIQVPPSTVQQVIRYDGQLKVLTVEANSIEALRMDLLGFTGEQTYPQIQPGISSWSVDTTFTGTGNATLPLAANSRMWFDEAYA